MSGSNSGIHASVTRGDFHSPPTGFTVAAAANIAEACGGQRTTVQRAKPLRLDQIELDW